MSLRLTHLAFALLLAFVASAQDSTDLRLPTFFGQLYQEQAEPVKMTLTTNIKKIMLEKQSDTYQPAKLDIHLNDSTSWSYQIQVKPRGNMRKEICRFPPIRLNFDEMDLLRAGLDSTHNKIKMVLQCDMLAPNDQYVWKEFMVYRMYNQVTHHSFRVKPVELTLLPEDGKGDSFQMYAFLIEPDDELADRLSGKVLKRTTCHVQWLQREPFLKMAAFEYMIGNTDWHVPNLHNMIVLKVPEFERMLPVPYDFDYSGLVNTHYAVPHTMFPIHSVTQRLYAGEDAEPEEAEYLRKHFLELQGDFLTYCADFPWLKKSHSTRLLKYLEDFFEELEKAKSAEEIFSKKF